MRTLATLAMVAAAMTAMPGAAGAMCDVDRPDVYPAGGTLPAQPRLYWFGRADGLRVEVDGRPARFAIRDVGVRDRYAMPVYELRLEATAGKVTIGGMYGERREYVIDEYEPPPAPISSEAKRIDFRWSCSYSDGVALVVRAPGVAAFRARWSDGVEAIVDPAIYVAPDQDADAAEARPFFGHASCRGFTIPPDHTGRLDVTVTALYADGSERPVTLPAPTLADVIALLVPSAGVELVTGDADPPPALLAPPPWWAGWRSPWLLSLGALPLAALALRARRRRVHARVP